MKIEAIRGEFTVCQLKAGTAVNMDQPFTFLSRTDEELSLVCLTEAVPQNTVRREDGWRMLRIAGVLDFALVGILSRIGALLASAGIPIFAISTYNTDYILVKDAHFKHALHILSEYGYDIKM